MWMDFLPWFLRGLSVTVTLALGATAIALPASLVAGCAATSERRSVLRAVATYTELFRGTSALIQLYWAYFVLPLLGVDIDAMVAAITVLGLNAGAYGAVVVRGAIAAVPPGQWEAAHTLGLSRRDALLRVVLPQALTRVVAPMNNVVIELLKNTSLASMITLADLTFEAQALRTATLRSLEVFTMLLVTYLALSLLITLTFRRVERLASAMVHAPGAPRS